MPARTVPARTTPAGRLRRSAVLAAPLTVPLSMTAVFRALVRRVPPRQAYRLGFVTYWTAWCLLFPLWVLGPRAVAGALRGGRRPTAVEAAVLLFPVIGALTTELAPRRHLVDRRVGMVMIGTAGVNALGEELLWRAVFARSFPGDRVRGGLWSVVGFTAWHVAPQVVLPSRRGRAPFLVGAALVGAASTVAVLRGVGLQWVVLAHAATDACGVAAARFLAGATD